ncbi:MAG TPA: metallophosphoesterase [Phycisphaerales bacterium]|nr:metallophosphoesterase [Phycisphaerales bacterium]
MSRYGVISDIHGNKQALDAVLEQLGQLNVDRIICLGDIVGYGPSPSQCLNDVHDYCHEIVRGNHDEAVIDPDLGKYFNIAASAALKWTRDQLTAHQKFLISTMKTRIRLGDSLLLVHDSPVLHDSSYIHELPHAIEAFESLEEGICLHGHTHLPTVFRATENENKGIEVTLTIPSHGDVTTLYPNDRYLCNPGSVGQPRDGDPRASFGVLDYTDQESEATFTLYRTEYDIEKAKKETHRVGLPSDLAERLEAGL